MNEKKCYSVKDIQSILGISRPTAYGLLKRQEFKWIRVGQRYVISKASFDRWLNGSEMPEPAAEC